MKNRTGCTIQSCTLLTLQLLTTLKRINFPKTVCILTLYSSTQLLIHAAGLFAHRKAGKLPGGEKITLLKVGGRTSAVVPSLQKKTGAVAADIGSKDAGAGEEDKPKTKTGSSKKRKIEQAIATPSKKGNSKFVKKENIKLDVKETRRSGRLSDNY
jgi:hypothetical protein